MEYINGWREENRIFSMLEKGTQKNSYKLTLLKTLSRVMWGTLKTNSEDILRKSCGLKCQNVWNTVHNRAKIRETLAVSMKLILPEFDIKRICVKERTVFFHLQPK